MLMPLFRSLPLCAVLLLPGWGIAGLGFVGDTGSPHPFAPATTRKVTASPASGPTAESLEDVLRRQATAELARRVIAEGDAARGALLYFNPQLTCVRCHEPAADTTLRLGPAIAEVNRDVTAEFLIESLLEPSRQITDGFQAETILTVSGRQVNGLVVDETDEAITLADPNQDGQLTRIAGSDVEERVLNQVSAMPTGLVGGLPDEQAFLDLVRYLLEIKQGGPQMELQLRPPDSFFAVAPLPDYEAKIDHAGILSKLSEESFQRGEAIYQRFCASCHGTRETPGTLPSALRFGQTGFKNGQDPHAMYQTLTHGYGLMVPQRWMVPQQKYDVIHYIREHFLRSRAPQYLTEITPDYLASLPVGTESGPDPVNQTPWSDMDYGNFLFNTYEVGDDGTNIAYKGLAVRLDQGPGGVSQGRHWMLYEHDTLRVAAAWSGAGFIDYNGIHFNDRHQVHPRVVGDVHFFNDHRPGWANPLTDTFDDDPRQLGRDQKRYGPLPPSWLKFRGLYQFDDRVVLNYSVGETAILESPSIQYIDQLTLFGRTLNCSPRTQPLWMKVASVKGLGKPLIDGDSVLLPVEGTPVDAIPQKLDGSRYLTAPAVVDHGSDITIAARIRTDSDGTLICQTRDHPEWAPGGFSLFIREGRLVFDVGWVGAVTSRDSVDDQKWHNVAMVWNTRRQAVRLYIDGQLAGEGQLAAGETCQDPIVRIGFTASDFPEQSVFAGDLANLRIWNRPLGSDELKTLNWDSRQDGDAVADWKLDEPGLATDSVADRSGRGRSARWQAIGQASPWQPRPTWSCVVGLTDPQWAVLDGSLCLRIPAGDEPLQLQVLVASLPTATPGESLSLSQRARQQLGSRPPARLASMTRGGPARYAEALTSSIETNPLGQQDAFAVDVLNHPEDNPWSCRMRLTGIDFEGQDRAVVCRLGRQRLAGAGLSGFPAFDLASYRPGSVSASGDSCLAKSDLCHLSRPVGPTAGFEP